MLISMNHEHPSAGENVLPCGKLKNHSLLVVVIAVAQFMGTLYTDCAGTYFCRVLS